MRRTLFAALALALSCTGHAATLFHNGRIRTLDEAQPLVEAMLVDDGGRVIALGDSSDLLERYADAARHDLAGAHVLPGLIDAHGHVAGLGSALLSADLVGATSKADIVRRLREFEANLPDGAWLTGRGWDQNRWENTDFPTAADLDEAFPGRPVWLRRVDGHAGWANSAALATVKRPLEGDWQPEGGRILRGGDGRATGVFIDTAMNLVDEAMPPPDRALRQRALDMAVAEAARLGLTGVHDAGVDLDTLALMRERADAGRLPIRIYAMADGDGATLDWLCENGAYAHPGGRLQMRAVKLYMDGALGSRGAALLRDYADDPGNRGLLVTAADRLAAAVTRADRCGIQVATHAIGDRGNRLVLDVYAALDAEGRDARRARIEHAQIVHPDDIARFAAEKVIASMQPVHATSDMPWAAARVGLQRLRGAYAWQRFGSHGTRMAFGSDFPVEAVNPFHGLYAAITRQDAEGQPEGGWLPDQRLDLLAALQGFTSGAAYAGFAEDDLGSLAVGKRADFIIVDRDVFSVPPAQVRATVVHSTWLDGRQVHPSLPAAGVAQ